MECPLATYYEPELIWIIMAPILLGLLLLLSLISVVMLFRSTWLPHVLSISKTALVVYIAAMLCGVFWHYSGKRGTSHGMREFALFFFLPVALTLTNQCLAWLRVRISERTGPKALLAIIPWVGLAIWIAVVFGTWFFDD